jgi:molybdate transport system substrate-binding protein
VQANSYFRTVYRWQAAAGRSTLPPERLHRYSMVVQFSKTPEKPPAAQQPPRARILTGQSHSGAVGAPLARVFFVGVTILLVLLALPLTAQTATPQAAPNATLRVAAAADLEPVLPTLAEQYEQQTHTRLVISYGSSASLVQQIENGAPVAVFLAADASFAQKIVDAGKAVEAQPVPYARGVLVLWSRNDSGLPHPLTLDVLHTSLESPTLGRVAVANAEHAPYGRAAKQAMAALGLTQILAPHLVIAENIAQTAQFAESGNAQVGFLSLTTANTAHFRSLGSFVRLPADSYAPLVQCGVVLRGTDTAAGEQFLRWLTSAAVQAELPRFGLLAAH